MAHYQDRDVSFDYPDNWEDRTVTAFAAPVKPGKKVAANIVITRDLVDGNEPVSAYADRQLVEMAKRLEGFNLLQRQETKVGGLPAVELSFTWTSGHGTLQLKQIFVVVRKRTVLSITATVPKSEYAEVEPTLKSLIASLKFPEAKP